MVLPLKHGSDGSYSSFSSASSRGVSEPRKYLDPWDLENALYVRGKRISFASDPSTYSATSAALGDDKPSPSIDTGYKAMAGSSTESAGYKVMAPYGESAAVYKRPSSSSCVDSGYCYCDYESPSYVDSSVLQPEPVPSMRYLNFCPYCDAAEQPKSLPYISSTQSNNNTGEASVDSCEECSVCSSVAPPPPLLLFSGAGGRALSNAGLSLGECHECQQQQQQQQRVTPSFSPSPRRASVPARPAQQAEELAYVYESPRARAKHSLPAIWAARDNADKTRQLPERSKRLSLATPPSLEICDYNFASHSNEPESLVPLRGPHAQLLAPPRHPCRWGMARSGHIAIDYTNAWMSLARRIRPSRS